MSKKVAVIIVAAGQGVRATTGPTGVPKQYVPLACIPLLSRSVAAFDMHDAVDLILPVIGRDHGAFYSALNLTSGKLLSPATGAASRQGSVLNGLLALEPHTPDLVLIHDAARPLVPAQVIENVLNALVDSKAALPVVPVTDTIKRSSDGAFAAGTLDRAVLWAAQTPQGFDFKSILDAHRAAATHDQEFTDDAAIAEWKGFEVKLVQGHPRNLKVTRPEDFALAEHWLGSGRLMETRTGTGLDIHRFEPGDKVRLAEVDIPHTARLSGHSDADAALHVLTDALLGALAEGDIGQHFPPSDQRWKGEPSRTFLQFAAERVAERGGRIVHLDLTLMCEAPKIGPVSHQMRQNIAEICAIDVSRVSVKATTAEKMGFVGRGEGLLAQGTATIELPRQP